MVDQARGGADDFAWQYRLMMPDHTIKYWHAVAHAADGQLEYIAAVQKPPVRAHLLRSVVGSLGLRPAGPPQGLYAGLDDTIAEERAREVAGVFDVENSLTVVRWS